jgi:MFS family permease
MNNNHHTPKNMHTFWIIWGGQFISMLGSGLTSFGLGVWIYDRTGQATPFALTALFSTLPALILMPIGGAIADRYNRRILMILSDTGSAIITALVALILFTGDLQVWHIYVLAFFASVFGAFQEPAYSASITMLVPKTDLARASGIMQMGQAGSAILTPVLAGGLYALIGLRGIIIIDAATYFFAIGALFIVRIPQPKRVSAQPGTVKEKQSILTDAAYGWKYLRALPGLFGLLVYFASVNFFLNFSSVLSGPLVLSYGSATDLGIVEMVSGAAMLTGSLIMSAWGGAKKAENPNPDRIHRSGSHGTINQWITSQYLADQCGEPHPASLHPVRISLKPGCFPDESTTRCPGAGVLHSEHDLPFDDANCFLDIRSFGRPNLQSPHGRRRCTGKHICGPCSGDWPRPWDRTTDDCLLPVHVGYQPDGLCQPSDSQPGRGNPRCDPR